VKRVECALARADTRTGAAVDGVVRRKSGFGTLELGE
jgi:hypothetical protein